MQRRPRAAAEAIGAASHPGFSAVDRFQSILPSSCWEPVPLGKGKHGTYQNLGDGFPARRTRCQDRSKSHVAGGDHEKLLRGSRRGIQHWGGSVGLSVPLHPLLRALEVLSSPGSLPHLLLQPWGQTPQQRSWGETPSIAVL